MIIIEVVKKVSIIATIVGIIMVLVNLFIIPLPNSLVDSAMVLMAAGLIEVIWIEDWEHMERRA